MLQDLGVNVSDHALSDAARLVTEFLDKLISRMLAWCQKNSNQKGATYEAETYGGGYNGCALFFSSFQLEDLELVSTSLNAITSAGEDMTALSRQLSLLNELVSKLSLAKAKPQIYRVSFQVHTADDSSMSAISLGESEQAASLPSGAAIIKELAVIRLTTAL